ncbi:MAG: methyl-accepting chemotaxis protein, partial [Silicimonas sp.]|nr:methyl-accepting chemotaxis protein [Silicimonas sp.]
TSRMRSVMRQLSGLDQLRGRIDRLGLTVADAAGQITAINRAAINLLPPLGSIISSNNASRAVQRQAIFMTAKDILGLERAIGSAGFAQATQAGTAFPGATLERFNALKTERQTLISVYRLTASSNMIRELARLDASQAQQAVNRLAQIAGSSDVAAIAEVGAENWFATITKLITLYKSLEDAGTSEIVSFIQSDTLMHQQDLRANLAQLALITLVLGAISTALVVFNVRSIKSVTRRVENLAQGDIESEVEMARQPDLAKITASLKRFQQSELDRRDQAEIQSRLEESSVQGIERIVEAVEDADFTSRLRLRNLSGASKILGTGINKILETAEETVGTQRARDQAVLEQQRQEAETQNKAVADLKHMVDACSNGNFKKRMRTENLEGVWREVSEGINQIASTCETSLGEIRHIMTAVADGNLTGRMDLNYKGTFAEISTATNTSLEKLHDAFFRISDGASSIESAVAHLETSTADLTNSSESQASSVNLSVAATDDLTKTLNDNTQQLAQCRTLIGQLDTKTSESQDVAEKAVKTMSSIEEASGQMSAIVATIDDIAFQTNLLALNASVEAARAGDAGKGFAVVASEVRSLAGRCADASSQIGGLISESVKQIKAGADNVRHTGGAIDEIRQTMGEVLQMIDQLSDAGRHQAHGIGDLGTSMLKLDTTAKSNLTLAKNNSELIERLIHLKAELSATVAAFLQDAPSKTAAA